MSKVRPWAGVEDQTWDLPLWILPGGYLRDWRSNDTSWREPLYAKVEVDEIIVGGRVRGARGALRFYAGNPNAIAAQIYVGTTVYNGLRIM